MTPVQTAGGADRAVNSTDVLLAKAMATCLHSLEKKRGEQVKERGTEGGVGVVYFFLFSSLSLSLSDSLISSDWRKG